MSYAKITELHTQIDKCDMYTQLAVLGSWSYTVASSMINQAARLVPDEPVDNGIETFTQYDAARKQLMEKSDTSTIPALINLHRDISQWIEDAGGEARALDDTLAFMLGNAPKEDTFKQEFENRRRLGMKPGITRKAFVESEMQAALKKYNHLTAVGQDAIRLCETVSFGNTAQDVPEWLPEALEMKMIAKLHTRWGKIEMSRTNPRLSKKQRDDAAADQELVEALLAEYGEHPGMTTTEVAEDSELARAEKVKAMQGPGRVETPMETLAKILAANLPIDPKKPGPVIDLTPMPDDPL